MSAGHFGIISLSCIENREFLNSIEMLLINLMPGFTLLNCRTFWISKDGFP